MIPTWGQLWRRFWRMVRLRRWKTPPICSDCGVPRTEYDGWSEVRGLDYCPECNVLRVNREIAAEKRQRDLDAITKAKRIVGGDIGLWGALDRRERAIIAEGGVGDVTVRWNVIGQMPKPVDSAGYYPETAISHVAAGQQPLCTDGASQVIQDRPISVSFPSQVVSQQ